MAMLSVAWVSSAQQTPVGELVVAGTTDWPTAEIEIFANGKYYRCPRDPVRGTLCRARVPPTTNAVRVEMDERGFLPFSKNIANVHFINNVARVDVGNVKSVRLPSTASDYGPLPNAKEVSSPEIDPDAPFKVIYIQQSGGDPESVHTFDVTFANTGKLIVLKQFEIHWSYESGGGSSAEPAHSLTPTERYIIELPINIRHPQDGRIQLLPFPLSVSRGAPTDPNVITLRLVLYYSLIEGGRHPFTNWDITYDLAVTDVGGTRTPIFVGAKWKLRN